MLYILTTDSKIDIFTDKGALFKATTLCPCESCDIACDQCAEQAECPHDRDGHRGGMCVSALALGVDGRGDTPYWFRLKYYHTYAGHVDCSCTEECAHLAPLVQEANRHAKGTRPSGVRKERFLSSRPNLITNTNTT